MKYLLSLVPAVLGLVACQSNSTATNAAGPVNPAPMLAAADSVKTAPANPEYADWSTLTVNGQPPAVLTIQVLQRQLGLPDSIAKGAVECGGLFDTKNSEQADFWYYGKTAYEVYGSQASITSFDVTTGKFRGALGPLLLDKNTTLEEVRRLYPVSGKQNDESSAGRPGEETVSLPFFSEGNATDGALLLLFQKGYLQTVDFWNPC